MNEGLLDRLKDYFDGKMSREEQLQLEAELAVNTELATIFDLYQTIENGIFETGQVSEEEVLLRQSLKGAHARFLEKHGHGQDTAGMPEGAVQTGPLHAAAPETGVRLL